MVVSAFFSAVFLNERLNFAGKIGMAQCVIGSVIVFISLIQIVMHTPATDQTSTIPQFIELVIKPAFLAFASLLLLVVAGLIFYVGPRYGTKLPIVYISICSLIGALVVVSTQGLGSALVYTASNPSDNQLLLWQTYLVLACICIGGVTQINYLNKALNLFSTAIVSPVYYVYFHSNNP